MSQVSITGDTQVMARLAKMKEHTFGQVVDRMEHFSAEMEVQAKNNRPWTDRTGNARRSITGSTGVSPELIRSVLAIGVFYGVFLELSHGGRLRIVEPTIMSFRPKFLKGLLGSLHE